MPQEVLDLHSGGAPYHRLFFRRGAFVDIVNCGSTDCAKLLVVRPNDADGPSVNEAL